jgi:hypothetical protein
LKVDIESYDHYCVEAIDTKDAPRYISIELRGLSDLNLLRRAGYTLFKIIHQGKSYRHAQFSSTRASSDISSLPQRLVTSYPSGIVTPEEASPGPSGPFGEDTEGEWHTFGETALNLLSLFLGRSQYGSPPSWFVWFDIHATTA